MPTKTTPKPRSRPGASSTGGRFGRPTATSTTRSPRLPSRSPSTKPRRATKGKGKAGGTALGGLISALPLNAAGKAAKRGGGSAGKGKPAVALLLAGAGAVLGRKQMRKRKDDAAVTPAAPAPEVLTTAPTGDETALRPPNGV